jgi:hypothetical protein
MRRVCALAAAPRSANPARWLGAGATLVWRCAMTPTYSSDPELMRILTAPGLNATQRNMAAILRLKAAEMQHDPAARWWVLPIGSVKEVSDLCGIHENTAGPVLDALHNAGIVSKHVERMAVNRFGQPIDARNFDQKRGDRWHVTTTITIAATPPKELMAPTTKKAKADNARAADNRELARMAKRALSLPCPHCGVVGELHIGCAACGCIVEPAADNAPQEIASTPPDPDMCRAEQGHPAVVRNRMQRLRTVKGRHVTPIDTPALDPETVSGVSIQVSANVANVATRDGKSENEKSPCFSENTDSVVSGKHGLFSCGENAGTQANVADVAVQTAPKFVTYCSEVTNFGVTSEAQKEGCGVGAFPDGLDYRGFKALGRVLTGGQIVDMLASVPGVAGFFEADPASKAAINPRDERGFPLNWRETPLPVGAAHRALANGKAVGVLCDSELRVLDIDAGALAFVKAFPQIGMTSPRVWRDNDTGRVKMLVRVTGAPDKTVNFRQSPDAARRVELLAHARIAGPHRSGAQLQAIAGNGELAAFEWRVLVEQLAAWAGVDNPIAQKAGQGEKKSAFPSVPHDSNTYGEVPAALQWWMAQPKNRQKIDRLIGKDVEGNAWFKVRNEQTPSVRLDQRARRKDKSGRRIYHDFGTGENLDDFELYVRLGNLDKRAEIARVCAAWREAGRPA